MNPEVSHASTPDSDSNCAGYFARALFARLQMVTYHEGHGTCPRMKESDHELSNIHLSCPVSLECPLLAFRCFARHGKQPTPAPYSQHFSENITQSIQLELPSHIASWTSKSCHGWVAWGWKYHIYKTKKASTCCECCDPCVHRQKEYKNRRECLSKGLNKAAEGPSSVAKRNLVTWL